MKGTLSLLLLLFVSHIAFATNLTVPECLFILGTRIGTSDTTKPWKSFSSSVEKFNDAEAARFDSYEKSDDLNRYLTPDWKVEDMYWMSGGDIQALEGRLLAGVFNDFRTHKVTNIVGKISETPTVEEKGGVRKIRLEVTDEKGKVHTIDPATTVSGVFLLDPKVLTMIRQETVKREKARQRELAQRQAAQQQVRLVPEITVQIGNQAPVRIPMQAGNYQAPRNQAAPQATYVVQDQHGNKYNLGVTIEIGQPTITYHR